MESFTKDRRPRRLGTGVSRPPQELRAFVRFPIPLDAAGIDIAVTLGTVPTTSKKHITHIFDKGGVDNRTQLIARFA